MNNKRGGNRKNAGRKETPDKLKQIPVSVRESKIKAHGEKNIKAKLKAFINDLKDE